MITLWTYRMRIVSSLITATAALLALLGASLVFAETNEVERAMVTDSDGDGVTDWLEWLAQTNPGDPSNRLEITSIRIEDGRFVLDWQSVGGSTYELISSPSAASLATNPQHVAFVTATGGSEPWYQTTATATNDITGSNAFFRIRLVVPENFEQQTMDMATFE